MKVKSNFKLFGTDRLTSIEKSSKFYFRGIFKTSSDLACFHFVNQTIVYVCGDMLTCIEGMLPLYNDILQEQTLDI